MITSSQKPGHQYLRKLLVLPVAAVIAALFAFSYKSINADDNAIRSKEQITVVVDVGHGGIDPGAKSPDGKYTEAQLALELSKKIEELSADYNVKVILTRDKDELPGNTLSLTEALKKRIEFARQYNPDAFISLHISIDGSFNKFQTKSSGFLAYITDEKPSGKNIALAKTVLSELTPVYTTDLGVRQREGAGIYVLDKNTFPTILLECGYINNLKDLEFITNKENQEKIAKAILNGVSKFANQDNLKDAINKAVRNEIKLAKEKSQLTTDTPKIKKVEVTLVDTSPLVFIDGKLHGKIDTRKLDSEVSPNDIESITVLKNAEATKLYGAEAKHGVILIYTKKYVEKHPEIKNEQEAQRNKYNKPTPPLQEVVVTGYKSNKPADPIFIQAETPPSFPGGKDAWRKYLEKDLNGLIPLDKGAKAGTYTVLVKFIVDKEGEITALEALTKHGHGMEEEVVRVIAKGPKWEPAKQNGHIVSAYHQQPVTFVITEDPEPGEKTPIITDVKETKIEYHNPNISVKDLKKATVYDLTKLEPGTEISTFTFSIDEPDGTIYEFVNTGKEIKSQVKEKINNAGSGRIITIDAITIVKDGKKLKMPAKVYYVKD